VAMGIRQRKELADVPITLLTQWQTAFAHPGLAARFVDPPAFAVVQLRIGKACLTTPNWSAGHDLLIAGKHRADLRFRTRPIRHRPSFRP